MVKLNLPNESLTDNNLTAEANYLVTLYSTKPRTNSGVASFVSQTSGITYSTETSMSGLYSSQGQEGLLAILQEALKDYQFTAEDYNIINGNITALTVQVENNQTTATTNITQLKEQLARNSYDDYQLWLELYYKGYISQVEAENAKAIVFDGFMDDDNIETNHYDLSSVAPLDTKTKSLYTAPCYVKFTTDETFGSVKNLSFPFKTTSSPSGDYLRVAIVGSDVVTGAPDDTVQLGYFSKENPSSPLLVDFGEIVPLEPNKSYFFKIYQYGNIDSAYYSLYYNDLNTNLAHQLWVDGAQVGNQEIIMSWEKIPSNVVVDLVNNLIVTGIGDPIYVLPASVVLWQDDDIEVQEVMDSTIIDNNTASYFYFNLPALGYKYFGQTFDLTSVNYIDSLIVKLKSDGSGTGKYLLRRVQYSLDNVVWIDAQNIETTEILISNVITTYYLDFDPVVARYIRISDWYHNSYSSGTETIYIYEYGFRKRNSFNSSLLTDVKALPFTPSLVDLYISVKEMTNAKAIPFVSFDGGVNYVTPTLIEERIDTKFADFKEKRYQSQGIGTNVKLKFNLTTDDLGNEFAFIKRYGLIIS